MERGVNDGEGRGEEGSERFDHLHTTDAGTWGGQRFAVVSLEMLGVSETRAEIQTRERQPSLFFYVRLVGIIPDDVSGEFASTRRPKSRDYRKTFPGQILDGGKSQKYHDITTG